ncbi:sulfatase-like hydrolase/transferase [Aliamphritea spongicola]
MMPFNASDCPDLNHDKNVLLITADQWRGSCLSALGHPVVKTPNLDRLASEGVTFTRHYSQATPCSPSERQFIPACTSITTGFAVTAHRCTGALPTWRWKPAN